MRQRNNCVRGRILPLRVATTRHSVVVVPGGGAIAASPIGCLPLDIPGRVKADALAKRTAKDYGKDAATLKDVLGRFPIKSLGPSTLPCSAMQAHKTRHGESVVVHRLWNTRRGFHTAISPCAAKEGLPWLLPQGG